MQFSALARLAAGALFCVAAATQAAPPTLASYVQSALNAHPEVQAAERALAASRAGAEAAAQPLYNPELVLDGARNFSESAQLGVVQTIDWHDRRGARRDSGLRRQDAARAALLALRYRLGTEILVAVARDQRADSEAELAMRRYDSLRRFADIARQQFEAGDIGRPDYDLARLAFSEAVRGRAESVSERIDARRRLAEATRLPQPPPLLDDELPAVPPDDAAASKVVDLPEVLLARADAAALRAEVRVAERARKANPTIGVLAGEEREDRARATAISVQLSIPLNIRNPLRAEVVQARARAEAAELAALDVEQRARLRLQAARDSFALLVTAWNEWRDQTRPSDRTPPEQLERAYRLGELSAADYLVQIRQRLDAASAGGALKSNAWAAYAEYLAASGTFARWLSDPDASANRNVGR